MIYERIWIEAQGPGDWRLLLAAKVEHARSRRFYFDVAGIGLLQFDIVIVVKGLAIYQASRPDSGQPEGPPSPLPEPLVWSALLEGL